MVVHRVDCLILLSVESKPLKEFNFDVAIECWSNAKERRGYKKLVKVNKVAEATVTGQVTQGVTRMVGLLLDHPEVPLNVSKKVN